MERGKQSGADSGEKQAGRYLGGDGDGDGDGDRDRDRDRDTRSDRCWVCR